MPADDGLRLNDGKRGSPSGPESRQGDPKGAIQRRETRPPVPMGVDRELLSQCQLDDRLILSA
ncbi:MAG TPA: hypothetical protein VEO55_10625 [Candidatus Dormibacteraeota bacterium]|nr:hypothetical protein [Candidatus Dormibacteraeota bacterium]